VGETEISATARQRDKRKFLFLFMTGPIDTESPRVLACAGYVKAKICRGVEQLAMAMARRNTIRI